MAGAWASVRLSDIGNSRTGTSRSPDSRGAPPRMAFALWQPASSWPVASVAGSGSPALPGHGQNLRPLIAADAPPAPTQRRQAQRVIDKHVHVYTDHARLGNVA